MWSYKTILKAAMFTAALCAPLILTLQVFAADSDVAKAQDFIRSIIKVAASFAGLIATAFFVAGGFGYITSSGNPEKLSRAKHTLIWSAIGLSIVIAAFVISSVVTDLATSNFGK